NQVSQQQPQTACRKQKDDPMHSCAITFLIHVQIRNRKQNRSFFSEFDDASYWFISSLTVPNNAAESRSSLIRHTRDPVFTPRVENESFCTMHDPPVHFFN